MLDVNELPECKVIHSYLRIMDFYFQGMQDDFQFNMFPPVFYQKFCEFRESYINLKNEFVSQLRFQNYG